MHGHSPTVDLESAVLHSLEYDLGRDSILRETFPQSDRGRLLSERGQCIHQVAGFSAETADQARIFYSMLRVPDGFQIVRSRR